MNLALKLQYKGTKYKGYQIQDDVKTVEGALQKAIMEYSGKKVNIIGSGRTDKGVHALGQVVNFYLQGYHQIDTVKSALNYYLDEDIRVVDCRRVPEDFHARFDAINKTYLYIITNKSYVSPILREYSINSFKKMNFDLFEKAAKELEGTHDFASFYKKEEDNPVNTIKTINYVNTYTIQEDILAFEINSKSFLYNMVRIIVNTLIDISTKKLDLTVGEILSMKNRSYSSPTAGPQGLYLKEVNYEKEIFLK